MARARRAFGACAGALAAAAAGLAYLPDGPLRRGLADSRPAGGPQVSAPSLALVVPGHGDARRTRSMVGNVVRVAQALPPAYRFECFIFAYTEVAITIPSPYNCSVLRVKGFWTDHMKMVQSNSTYVAVMMDDVSPAGVRMPSFLRTMQQYDIEVAAPVQPSWHWKVMMRDAERKCVVRVTRYVDMLFTVFSHRAWECWRGQIDTEKNSMGWGMDATFHFTCGMRMGLLDEHMAVHEDLTSGTDPQFAEAKATRTYNETLAHLELAEWLADKAMRFNVTHGWDVDGSCARSCAPPGKPSIKKHYMEFLMGIANGPTECIPANGSS